jgi:hypothetical protein
LLDLVLSHAPAAMMFSFGDASPFTRELQGCL